MRRRPSISDYRSLKYFNYVKNSTTDFPTSTQEDAFYTSTLGTFTYSKGAESSSTPSSEDDISKTTTPGPSNDIIGDATSSYSTTRETMTGNLVSSEFSETTIGVTNSTTAELLELTTTLQTTTYSSSTTPTSPSSLVGDDLIKVFLKRLRIKRQSL